MERVRFLTRLAETLTAARAGGGLAISEYESLLLDPDFDERDFAAFREQAATLGIALPEAEIAVSGSSDLRAAPGEADRDLLDLYLNEIGRIPLLPHEELLEVSRRARGGDELARKRVILSNLRLVVHLARGYRGRGLPMLDLIEEGNLGLIHAADRFEPERGLHFSTYAVIWIRQSILRAIAEQSRAVRIPVQMFQQASRYVRVERLLRHRLGREPIAEELARELGISVGRTERLAALLAGFRSFDDGSAAAAFDRLTLEDLGDPPASVERLIELQLEHEKIDRLLRSLSQREEQVLRIRFGFLDGDAHTLQQTGEHFGISRERVRQIEARALDKLRKAIEYAELHHGAGTLHH
ncbi:MAG: RNA polymerase sigma factor RpoD/SigA [Candidatus Eisenbacteria bacterium]|uniref:RNA polymerase sigma factor n=1 Tax=Eiseniibacteriota bacterium TaxID=2212470 RepID=A0A849SRW0_UNCEI|nr:RNA polymerase sigma factor RpoD/SigA [Candidatus Eisenbacteria bacterium]